MLRMFIQRKLNERAKRKNLEAANHSLLLQLHHDLSGVRGLILSLTMQDSSQAPTALHAIFPGHSHDIDLTPQQLVALQNLGLQLHSTTTGLLASIKKNQLPKTRGVLDMAGSPPAPATDIASVLAALTADVAAETTAVASAETLMTGLNAALQAEIQKGGGCRAYPGPACRV